MAAHASTDVICFYFPPVCSFPAEPRFLSGTLRAAGSAVTIPGHSWRMPPVPRRGWGGPGALVDVVLLDTPHVPHQSWDEPYFCSVGVKIGKSGVSVQAGANGEGLGDSGPQGES